MNGLTERLGRFKGRKKSFDAPAPSMALTPQEISDRIDTILNREQDRRTDVYGKILDNLPPGTLPQARRVLEVGLNQRLFLFREVFPLDFTLFGLTLDPQHANVANSLAAKHEIPSDIRIHDVDQGLPTGFNQMDLVIDIVSATHYARENPVRKYVQALKPGGVLAIVPGMDLTMTEMIIKIREYPQLDGKAVFGYPPLFRYDKTRDALFFYADLSTIAHMLRENYPSLSIDATQEEIVNCIKDMAERIEEPVITDKDGYFLEVIRTFQEMGLSEVKMIRTNDGSGWIARKNLA